MDCGGASSAKRPRMNDRVRTSFEDNVFPFQIRRKFTGNSIRNSIITEVKSNQEERLSRSLIPIPPMPNATMKFVPNKEINISKVQTLKLKSPDGRDLGEINVKILPQKGSKITGKTITLKKHSMFGKLDKSSSSMPMIRCTAPNKITENTKLSLQPTPVNSVFTRKVVPTSNNSVVIQRSMMPLGKNSVSVISSKKSDSAKNDKTFKACQPEIAKCETISNHKVYVIRVDNSSDKDDFKFTERASRSVAPLPMSKKLLMVRQNKIPSLDQNRPSSLSECLNNFKPYTNRQQISNDIVYTASTAINVSTIPIIVNKRYTTSEDKFGNGIQNSTGRKTEQIERMRMDLNYHSKPRSRKQTFVNTSTPLIEEIEFSTYVPTESSRMEEENYRASSCEDNYSEASSNMEALVSTTLSNDSFVAQSTSKNLWSTTKSLSSEPCTIREYEGDTCSDDNKTDENPEQIEENSDILNNQRTQPDDSIENNSNNNDKHVPNLGKNVMVRVHNDTSISKDNIEKSTESTSPNNVSIQVENEKNIDVATLDTQIVEQTTNIKNDNVNNSQKPVNKNDVSSAKTAKEKDLDILQRALSTLTDENMREKALQALASCGISLPREVPVKNTVSVNDSQTQTNIFSLLESGSFLECDNELQSLIHVPLTTTRIAANNLNTVGQNMNSLNQQYLSPDESLIFPTDVASCLYEFSPEKDLFEDLLPNSTEVHKIRDILSESSPKVVHTLNQLRKDFEAAKTADKDGFFGIHRAVLTGSAQEVQRQLIVLKALNRTLDDVRTEDRYTSLELAVKYDIGPAIVKLLLDAGAKPAFPDRLHESAIIIACKTSSIVLPELVKRVVPTTLLDIVDCNGFTPLHYCARAGNFDGVKSLIAAGVDVNLRDLRSGRTPLFHALEGHFTELSQFLLNNGAKPNISNFSGHTPTALIDEYKNSKLAECFASALG